MREEKCCAGCKRFTGDETYHLPECYFYEESMSKMYDEACKELKELKEKHRWRKVSEELPNNGQIILIKTIDSTYHTASYYANRGDFYSISMYELDDYELFLIDGIVEWKPID